MARMLERLGDAGRRSAFLESARAVINIHGQKSSAIRLMPSYRMPLFVLWGTRDRVIPARHVELIRDVRPDAHVVLLDGVGHSPHLAQPTVVAEALSSWISSGSRPRPRPKPRAGSALLPSGGELRVVAAEHQ
jgi:pimeloyl-ACP methyl ester carboxylesterase